MESLLAAVNAAEDGWRHSLPLGSEHGHVVHGTLARVWSRQAVWCQVNVLGFEVLSSAFKKEKRAEWVRVIAPRIITPQHEQPLTGFINVLLECKGVSKLQKICRFFQNREGPEPWNLVLDSTIYKGWWGTDLGFWFRPSLSESFPKLPHEFETDQHHRKKDYSFYILVLLLLLGTVKSSRVTFF